MTDTGLYRIRNHNIITQVLHRIMQGTIIDPSLNLDKTALSTELKFAKYWNNCMSTMSESHRQPCSSPEIIPFTTHVHRDQTREQADRTPTPEPSEKSVLSSADASCINRITPKDVDSLKSTSLPCSLDSTSIYTDVSPKETFADERTSSNVSSTRSATSSVSSNVEKYFHPFSGSEISEKDLTSSYTTKISQQELPGSHATEIPEDCSRSHTFSSSPVYNESHGPIAESNYVNAPGKLNDLMDNPHKVTETEKDINNHLSTRACCSPVKALSVQKRVEHSDENCMKFAEVLYKCTLCTTLPSILTSKQSFLSHVRKQHLIEEMSRFSCKPCMLNFCTEEDLNFHKTTCHTQVGKGPPPSLSLSESSEESDSNEISNVQMHGLSSKIMWCSEKEHNSPNPGKSNSYPKMFKPFQDSPDSTSHGISTVVSGTPKGQKPLELRRGIVHGAYPSSYKQNRYYPYNKFVEQNTLVNSFPLTGIAEIDKLTNQMVHPQTHNLGTMSTISSNLNSFTPEFGRYTKLVREGGNIVYFCQVCNWKCPVKTIFQTHCRGIQHQTKVQSADDSSGNSSNSPGPTPVSDTKSDKDLLKKGLERNPVNLCLNEDSRTRVLDRVTHGDSRRNGDLETEKMSSHGNKSPLRSLLSSSHRMSVPRSSPGVGVSRNALLDRPDTSMKFCTSAKDYRKPCATPIDCHADVSGIQIPFVGSNAINLTADIIYSQCRNYEFSRGNYPFCNSPNKEYASRITPRFHTTGNSANKLSSCRNRRKRPAPVALRNQFSDSDTDSDLDVQKRKKEETYLDVTSKTKKELSLIDSSSGLDMNLNKHSQGGKVTMDNTKRGTTIQSSTKSTNQQPSYYRETNHPPLSPVLHCVQPHDISRNLSLFSDEHKTTSLSTSTDVQIKQEPIDDESRSGAYTCSDCGFTTGFVDIYKGHMARGHSTDSVDTSSVWRHSDSAMLDRPDYLVGEHGDDFTTDRTNVNSEGWKIVKIKAALPDIVQASSSGNVSRDILLQKVSLVVNLPDVAQWGPACNKAVREVFPASSAQRKGKYKNYFFGLEYVEQSTQAHDDSSDPETINYQPLRDMSHDLDLIIRFLPETLSWTGDMESGVARDQLLDVLAAKIRDPDIHHWGVQCNRAARMMFPDVQMRRKGKYKSTVFYGVEFVDSLQKQIPLKPGRSHDQKLDDSSTSEPLDDGILVNDPTERNNHFHHDYHFEKSSPRFQHHWHSNGKLQDVHQAEHPNIDVVKADLETSQSPARRDAEDSETIEKASTTLVEIAPSTCTDIPHSETSRTFEHCSLNKPSSANLTNSDDTLRQM